MLCLPCLGRLLNFKVRPLEAPVDTVFNRGLQPRAALHVLCQLLAPAIHERTGGAKDQELAPFVARQVQAKALSTAVSPVVA